MTDSSNVPTVPSDGSGRVLVTGGAGFIGLSLVSTLTTLGRDVTVLDSLSRSGSSRNAELLSAIPRVKMIVGDVRDRRVVNEALDGATEVFHFAAQVAVTTSVSDPINDFDVNAYGTVTLLEAIRSQQRPPSLVFASTNKVYGDLGDLVLRKENKRYVPCDPDVQKFGVNEARPLSFDTFYACSKGIADAYVLNYSRHFDLPATVLRLSCVYGPNQLGTEDQGWVAHFARQARTRGGITVFGNGRQVRDLLFINDLLNALSTASRLIEKIRGHAFNVGGGPSRSISVSELIDVLGTTSEHMPKVTYAGWRPNDQRFYVSDIRRFGDMTGWTPTVSLTDGLRHLHAWLSAVC